MENLFYFVTNEVVFQESNEKGAFIEATVMELEKVSKNGRLYQISEGEEIAKSLVGNEIYHGVDMFGKHDNPITKKKSRKDPVGVVKSARVVGKKIKAVLHIFNQGLIEALKQGVKFLFSVGGNAISETIKKIGQRIVHVLHGARCNHLQILDIGTPVGFPDAKMEKLIEINETVMICEGGLCPCDPAPKKRKVIIVETEEIIEFDQHGIESIELEE